MDERVRFHLWINHGHNGLYGDDGEMQCNTPPSFADFGRDSMDDLLAHCDLARLRAAPPAERLDVERLRAIYREEYELAKGGGSRDWRDGYRSGLETALRWLDPDVRPVLASGKDAA